MNMLSCQESEGSDYRDRGMSVKSEVGCLSVLKKCQKILADFFCEMALCNICLQ